MKTLLKRKMDYFIRYTQNAKLDIERKYSYHHSDYKVGDVAKWDDEDERQEEEILSEVWNCEIEDVVIINNYYSQKLSGLCAFELSAHTEEEAIEEATKHYYNSVYNTKDFPSFSVFAGEYINECPEGCLFMAIKIIYESK